MPNRMMKLTPEKRVELVERYSNGEDNMINLAPTTVITSSPLRNWIMPYENGGPTGFLSRQKNIHYTIETTIQAINDFLNGL